MKKVRLPIIIQDPTVNREIKLEIAEGFNAERENFYDGPMSDQVEIRDETYYGEKTIVKPKAKYHVPKKYKIGWYKTQKGKNLFKALELAKIHSERYPKELNELIQLDEFVQASVFATVLKTLDLVEKGSSLERPFSWGFDQPKLIVYPRYGVGTGGAYIREENCIKLYFKTSPKTKEKVYGALSRDVIAHETGHAIVDGLAPSLYTAVSPQSLGIHEAVADLTSMLMAMSSRSLRGYLINHKDGTIIGTDTSYYTEIAEEVGESIFNNPNGLRNLINQNHLNADRAENQVDRLDPYQLCTVLSGALYNFLVEIHNQIYYENELEKWELNRFMNNPEKFIKGVSIDDAVKLFSRMIYCALDYLAPGETTFIDFGRALSNVIVQEYFNFSNVPREILEEEFERRGIISNPKIIAPQEPFAYHLDDWDMLKIVEDNNYAMKFLNSNRALFGILPDEDVTFVRYTDPSGYFPAYIFKASWEIKEDNDIGDEYPKERWITVGTTIVVRPERLENIASRLTSAPPNKLNRKFHKNISKKETIALYETFCSDRTQFLKSLVGKSKHPYYKQQLNFRLDKVTRDNKIVNQTAIKGEIDKGALRLICPATSFHNSNKLIKFNQRG